MTMSPSSDVHSGTAKLVRVGLSRATRYYTAEGETMSDALILKRDFEVLFGDSGDVPNVFERDDGETIFVPVEAEIHDVSEEDDD